MSSSPIPVLSRRPLLEVFEHVEDPRARRGVRHRLATVLTVAQAAVAAGCRTLLAISEWAADADRDALSRLGIGPDVALPSESTIRRTLAAMNGDGLDLHITSWMAIRTGRVAGRQVIAIDGKSMRGGTGPDGRMPHLLAALDQGSGTVVGQRAVAAKSNEIPALPLLLASFDLDGVVVTADALHCQRATAEYITGRCGHYALTVKDNQRKLRRTLKKLPWDDIPDVSDPDTGHGRKVRRTVKAVDAPDWIDFPGAGQVLQIRRTRTLKGKKTTEVVYVICSLTMAEAQPRDVAAWVTGHWSIESLHWIRDVVFDEDRHQLRTGDAPQVMATLRNTAISLIRLAGHTRISARLRHNARNDHRVADLILTT